MQKSLFEQAEGMWLISGFSSGFAGGRSENPDRETNLDSKEGSDTMTP